MLKRAMAAGCVLASVAVSVWAGPLTAEGAWNRMMIGFRDGVAFEQGRRLVESQGLTVVGEIPEMNVLLAQAAPGTYSIAAQELRVNSQVSDVEPDVWLNWLNAAPDSFSATPLPSLDSVIEAISRTAPFAATAAYSSNPGANEVPWGIRRVNAPAAWPTNQGQGVKVCVVDTGIDAANPDLAGQVEKGYNALNHGASWTDDHFHGTHVAGIIAAKLDGQGVVGVAPLARLYAAKVLNKDGSGSMFTIMDGINWCAKQRVQVINMSLGAPQSSPLLERTVRNAYKKGVTIVAAAGNGVGNGQPGPVEFPAAYKECIAVSALDETDAITPWSSRGPEVAFIAPGHKILSDVPTFNDPSGLHAYSGTSMASPHVAGLAALAVASGADGPAAVREILTQAAEKVPNLTGDEQGAGVINAVRLIR